MKKALDKFSEQSDAYKKFRPTYPDTLYADILAFANAREACWDCGTGNGQVAVELSKHFDRVVATDLSVEQIRNAEKRRNISYKVERAEHTSFKDDQFDLITVAQAFHWFDFSAFNKEARRVSKNGGLVSIWGYGLLRISPPIDQLIDHFYYYTVGPYWDAERKHVDNSYSDVEFDFEPIDVESDQGIAAEWDLKHLEGYLNSWSSVHNYIREKNKNPVIELVRSLGALWDDNSKKRAVFPIFMKMGRVIK